MRLGPSGASVVLASTLLFAFGCGDGQEELDVTATPSGVATTTASASVTASAVPTAAPIASTPVPTLFRPSATMEPVPPRETATPLPPTGSLVDGKWHYTPPDSTCIYVESERSEALYRDFANADVVLMDSENCYGTWYIYYPSTGEAFGGISDPDNPRLRLRLVDGKVTVLPSADGCTWSESRRQPDSQSRAGGIIVVLETACDYDYGIWYFPATGELSFVVA